MKGQKLWSDEEIDIIRRLTPDYHAICKKLPKRTRIAIRSKACRLGVTTTIHIWTGAEITLLRKLYPSAPRSMLSEKFPNVTWEAIQSTALSHGFRRARKPYTGTGIPPLDEIRRRCFDIRWTMADLDEVARTKNYFAGAQWRRTKTVNYNAIVRAIQSLDGEINIKWS